jgi:thioredoxin-dependent peroxiredoxin
MAHERTGPTTFGGRPVTLVGPRLSAGDPAPDFTALAPDLTPVTFSELRGTVRVVSAVPSLETPVCDLQARRFHQEATGTGVHVLTVSADLPFAQARWCAASGSPGIRTLSDHRDLSFGRAYGVLIAELRLLARAVFVVDARDTIVHADYVSATEHHPYYQSAMRAVWDAYHRDAA